MKDVSVLSIYSIISHAFEFLHRFTPVSDTMNLHEPGFKSLLDNAY